MRFHNRLRCKGDERDQYLSCILELNFDGKGAASFAEGGDFAPLIRRRSLVDIVTINFSGKAHLHVGLEIRSSDCKHGSACAYAQLTLCFETLTGHTTCIGMESRS